MYATRKGQIAAVPVENDTKAAAHVWLWPKSEGRYAKPSLVVPAEASRRMKYRPAETYWIIAVDSHGRQAPIGWFVISDEVGKNPKVRLILSEAFEQRQAEESIFNSQRGQWERRTRTYKVSKFYGHFSAPPETSNLKAPPSDTRKFGQPDNTSRGFSRDPKM